MRRRSGPTFDPAADTAAWLAHMERRQFELLEEIRWHGRTCPQRWYPMPGRVDHCAERRDLSDAHGRVYIPLSQGVRDLYLRWWDTEGKAAGERFDLNARITEHVRGQQARYEAWRRRQRWRFWRHWFRRRPTHTPFHVEFTPSPEEPATVDA